MIKTVNRIECLAIADLKADAIWQFANIEALGETHVRPVTTLPVKSPEGTANRCASPASNRSLEWILLGSLNVANPRLNLMFCKSRSSATVSGFI
jgi:hypothetical protein